MCTAVSFLTKDHYFGRNLDLEYSYHETVTIMPRNFPIKFSKMGTLKEHYAMIGMAFVANNYPLYYDATNEKGLSMAGLNFPLQRARTMFRHTSLSHGCFANAKMLKKQENCSQNSSL